MVDHILFHNAYWIQRTDDVKAKLDNYDSLKSFHDKVSNMEGDYAYSTGAYAFTLDVVNDELIITSHGNQFTKQN